tara:strand:- start:1306 stop:1800 length:495 start_codon:yes stop_codon:yes gene_type:complete
MNKIQIIIPIILVLSIVTIYLNIPIIPVILFGTSVVLFGYEVVRMFITNEIVVKEKEVPFLTTEDLPSLERHPETKITKEVSLIKEEVLVAKITRKTPCQSPGTKLVKPLVEEQLNSKFRESVKKAPVKKQVSQVIKGDPLAKDKPKRKYKKRKPRVKNRKDEN